MKIFNEVELSSFIQLQHSKIKAEIEQQSEEYLLNVNEDEFIEYLVSKYIIDDLDILWDKSSYTEEEKVVEVRDVFDRRYIKVKRPVITLEIPFVGNKELLRYVPSTWILWTREVRILNNSICLEVIVSDGNMEKVNDEYDNFMITASKQLSNVKNDVYGFNDNLKNVIESTFKKRKCYLLQKRESLTKINLPLKKKDNVIR